MIRDWHLWALAALVWCFSMLVAMCNHSII